MGNHDDRHERGKVNAPQMQKPQFARLCAYGKTYFSIKKFEKQV